VSLDPSITAALAALRTRRDSIDRAIAALLALDEDSQNGVGTATTANEIFRSAHKVREPPPRSSEGGGQDGARKVLRDSPGRGFTAAQLAQAMKANGWITSSKNPRAAARASANRLREDAAEHVFFEDGQFVYRPQSEQLAGLDTEPWDP